MWDFNAEINVHDSVYGVVVNATHSGVELLLETGERAFAFFGAIPLNTEVLYTVLRKPTPGRLLLVSVDAQDCLVA